MHDFPYLYSLRNCPFAMRARLAIYKSAQPVFIREVDLRNKPSAMVIDSPKATVPILVVSQSLIIEESLEVMLWSLAQNDPQNLLRHNDDNKFNDILTFIYRFDHGFKSALEDYKCAKRYREDNVSEQRAVCEVFINELEQRLGCHQFVMDEQESLADIAILPFVRQFARVERKWYVQSPYPNVKRWLNRYLQHAIFSKVMTQFPCWQAGDNPVVYCA